MIQIPILGALASAIGTIIQKKILRYKDMDIKRYLHFEFVSITLVALIVTLFFWKLDAQAFQPMNLFILILVIIFSIIANLFLFYSLKWEKITNLEPAKVLEPLFVVIIAVIFSFFLSQELYPRNYHIIIPALIAGLALIFSHIEKHHLRFNKYFIAMVLSSLFFAIELAISKLILEFYSPISFYFLRSLGVLILSLAIFRPRFKKINRNVKLDFFYIGIVWVIFRVCMYWGYQSLGVISTTLIMMLTPIFIYIIAYFFLKEKIKWKNFIAAMIIVGCVIYALLTN
jgi:drug/metabolite transporter (DMT)-like permease